MHDLQGYILIEGIHKNGLHCMSQVRFQELLHLPLLVETMLLGGPGGKLELIGAVLFVV